MTFCKYPS